ncbi:unnamed protein product [Soboliphyme baturini]|uniref:Bromo domain-containing protein n=1 Tax=Soboliphyme baturini TaxID=241478 RepID=A0A183IPY8_9BILA|nr:unnamed protein product [Soboliphyme baturini]
MTSIKKDIDSFKIKTTDEFLHMLHLMFANAVMYNNSQHVVNSMAQEMAFDVIDHLKAILDISRIDVSLVGQTGKFLRTIVP